MHTNGGCEAYESNMKLAETLKVLCHILPFYAKEKKVLQEGV